MTTAAQSARDEQLIASITVALTHGLVVTDTASSLFIFAEQDHTYIVRAVVEDMGIPAPRDEAFGDVWSAVAYFLDLRDER